MINLMKCGGEYYCYFADKTTKSEGLSIFFLVTFLIGVLVPSNSRPILQKNKNKKLGYTTLVTKVDIYNKNPYFNMLSHAF